MPGEQPSTAPEGAVRGRSQQVRRRRRRGVLYGVGGAVGVALVGATASALITPERLDALFGWSPATAGVTPTPVSDEMKTITTGDNAVAVEVPDAWAARDSSYDTFPFAGSALLAGTQIDARITPTHDGLYLDASTTTPVEHGLADLTVEQRTAALKEYVAIAEWDKEGCVPGSEPARSRDGWLVVTRLWQDCVQTEGLRAWEIAALSDDAAVLVTMQITLRPQSGADIVDRIVASFAVDEAKLPSGTRLSGDAVTP